LILIEASLSSFVLLVEQFPGREEMTGVPPSADSGGLREKTQVIFM